MYVSIRENVAVSNVQDMFQQDLKNNVLTN